MPLVVADRVRETTTTTGTGTITLAGAVTGYQSFSAIGNGNTTYYTINAGSQWEVGIGTYSGTGPTLSRDTVLESSNSGSLVDFAAGTKDVFVTYPAEKSISDGYGLLPIANGGTGATTAPNALTALGAYPASNPSGFTSNTGTVTSVDLTAGTGISVSGGPVTSSGAITVTNTAPDQVVSLTGAGTTVITGTYPNFTVTSNDSTTGTVTSVGGTGTVNGITLTGTVTTSGNLTLGGTLSGVNLTSQVTGTLPIANGGTNATTATDALTSLGAYPATNPSGYTSNTGTVTSVGGTGTVNGLTLTGSVTTSGNLTLGGTLSGVDLTSQVTGTLPVANGGTGLSASGAAGNVLTSDGTVWVSQLPAAGGITYTTVKTSNYTASVNDGVQTDTSGGAFTVTLPATPAVGDQVIVVDSAGSWATNNLTVGRNGSTIEGSATDLTCDISSVSVQFVYSGTTWDVYAQVGGASAGIISVAGGGTGVSTLTGYVKGSGTSPLTASATIPTSDLTGTLPVANGGTGVTTSTGTGNVVLSTSPALSKAVLNDGYTEEVFTITDGTVSLDPNNGSIQTWTLGANRTPDQANWAAGQSITLMIDDGSAYTITWTTLAVVWETNGGTAPTLATSGYTVIVLWKVGTTIYGARVGDA